jgi:sulfur carrier protein
MITVVVNGQHWLIAANATIADVVARLSAESRGVAVALDGAVVPRANWAATQVRAGAVIEVLTAVQGG